jgi:hypothetical protein
MTMPGAIGPNDWVRHRLNAEENGFVIGILADDNERTT